MFEIAVSSVEARRRLSTIGHRQFRKSIEKNWKVDLNGFVSAKSICWLVKWALNTDASQQKSGWLTQLRHLFEEVIPISLSVFEDRVGCERAKKLHESRRAEDRVRSELERLLEGIPIDAGASSKLVQSDIGVWKISPGDNAKNWGRFCQASCIGVGWLKDESFLDFADESQLLSAIERQHGKGKKGKGAARMAFVFANQIKRRDVVVANKGLDEVVGIGVVQSAYMAPSSSSNPLRSDETTHRRHVRMVDWVIQKSVSVPNLFTQPTITRLGEEKILSLVDAYLTRYRSDPTLAKTLDKLFASSRETETVIASDLGDVQPGRVLTTTYRILRDTSLAREVKEIHDFRCQVCGHVIVLPDGSLYAEAHHIKPLGSPHDGPDIAGNILCVCPNHHAECDLGVLELSVEMLRAAKGHVVSDEFIEYHNREIYRG